MWWIIAFGFSLSLCTLMVMDVLHGWRENPIKIKFIRKEKLISEIPFPTVTICPYIKTNKSKVDFNPLYIWFDSKHSHNSSIGMR